MSKKTIENSNIDIVILWVDGLDSIWLRDKNSFAEKNSDNDGNSNNRFRDWGLLKYWFRSIEKNAPWVRKIHFVTYGHTPEWLDCSNPKLNIVKHDDFIPKEYLPTFNSNVIQYYLNRIDGISDRFILFDDDQFILRSVRPCDFYKGDKIKETYSETALFIPGSFDVYPHSLLNNLECVNKYYNKRVFYKKYLLRCINPKFGLRNIVSTLATQRWSYFTGFYSTHICQAYTKKGYNLFWKYCGKQLEQCSHNRFRKETDFTTFLIRYILMLEGDFCARKKSFGRRFELDKGNNKIVLDAIRKRKYHVICINDSNMNIDYEKMRKELASAFDSIFSERCSYEK